MKLFKQSFIIFLLLFNISLLNSTLFDNNLYKNIPSCYYEHNCQSIASIATAGSIININCPEIKLIGDLNNDGILDNSDLQIMDLIILEKDRLLIHNKGLQKEYVDCADFDNNGINNDNDKLLLKKLIMFDKESKNFLLNLLNRSLYFISKLDVDAENSKFCSITLIYKGRKINFNICSHLIGIIIRDCGFLLENLNVSKFNENMLNKIPYKKISKEDLKEILLNEYLSHINYKKMNKCNKTINWIEELMKIE